MQPTRGSRVYTLAAVFLALAITAGAPPARGEDEDREPDPTELPDGEVVRTRCPDGLGCIHPDATCCTGLGMCCPSGLTCPEEPGEECIYTEPEDTDVPR